MIFKILNRQGGFTLVEVIVALALAAVLTTAIVLVYGNFHEKTSCVELKLDAQQRARVATLMIHEDMLQIGSDVPKTVNAIEPGMSATAVTMRYHDPISDERVKVSYRLNGTSLEREYCNVAISFDDGTWNVCKTPTEYQAVVGDIASLNIEYLDADGVVTADEDKVRFINVEVEAAMNPECIRAGAATSVKVQTRVRLRNFSLVLV